MTDVTGFGLLGHAMEMAVASGLTLQIAWDQIPTWPGAVDLAKQGVRTGASERNWSSLSASVALADDFSDWRRDVVCDPQTSGGLLIAAAPEQADGVLELLRDRGFDQARRIGRAVAGPGGVELSRALPGA
jgi:selenide,water dikinase